MQVGEKEWHQHMLQLGNSGIGLCINYSVSNEMKQDE